MSGRPPRADGKQRVSIHSNHGYAFGFKIPEGCSPDYVSKKKSAKHKGRPRKKIIERDLS
jgi:hypothetical protein